MFAGYPYSSATFAGRTRVLTTTGSGSLTITAAGIQASNLGTNTFTFGGVPFAGLINVTSKTTTGSGSITVTGSGIPFVPASNLATTTTTFAGSTFGGFLNTNPTVVTGNAAITVTGTATPTVTTSNLATTTRTFAGSTFGGFLNTNPTVVTGTGQITITAQALGFTINLGTSTIYPTSGSSVRITPVTNTAPTISTSRPVGATITPVRLASTQIANTITRSPNVSFVNRSTTVINPTVQIAPSMRILFLSAPPTITTPTGPTVIPDTYVDAYQDAY